MSKVVYSSQHCYNLKKHKICNKETQKDIQTKHISKNEKQEYKILP